MADGVSDGPGSGAHVGGIDELLEATTVDFPKPFRLHELEKFFVYLCQQHGIETAYTVEKHKRTGTKYDDQGNQQKAEKPLLGTVSAAGMMHTREPPFKTCGFRTEHARNTSRIKAVHFETIPGYDALSEYRPEEVQFWAYIKRAAQEYFSKL
ncbi:hypothetical protein HY493_05365 [Candidatus Woesearchaeota archaeon]|nr:hypothetical protein [Candidatus Woesearchaeota archaeon]